MLNLLLPENKEINKKDYYIRLVILFLLFVFFSLMLSIVYFLPSYFYSNFKKNDLFEEVNNPQKASLAKEELSLSNFLDVENGKLSILKGKTSDTDLNELLRKVIDRKSKDILINSFFYEKQEGGFFLTIKGVAETRDQLVDFAKSLEGESGFTKIDLPVSNLVKDKKVDFLIKITLKS